MPKKTSLITGCAGFLGSHLVDFLLEKKHKVIGIDNLTSGKNKNIKNAFKNKNFLFIRGNIKNINKLLKKKKLKIDYVFHFAGHGELIPSIEKPVEYFSNNAMNTVHLVDYILLHCIYIFTF